MYTVSDELEEEDCKVPKGIIYWFLKKLIFHWEPTKDCRELADSIYVPLFLHLVQEFYDPKDNNKRVPAKKRITLPFSKIKEILGNPLPQEARRDNAWWKNKKTSVQARAWRLAGWKTDSPDVSSKKITFVRGRPLLGPMVPLIYKVLLLTRYNTRYNIK